MAKSVEAAVGRQNAVLDQQYELELENYNNQVVQEKELRELKDAQNLRDYEYQTGIKEAQEQAQVNAYEHSNEVYENNLKSIDFYADTARSRVQLGLDEQIADLSFQLEDLDRDFSIKAAAAAFADTEQQQIIDNAKQNAELSTLELANQRAEGQAKFDAQLANIAEEETKLSNDLTIEQNRITSLYGEGGIKKTELEKFGIESTAAQRKFEIGQEQAKAFDIESALKTGQLDIREQELDYLKFDRESKEGELKIRTDALKKFDIEEKSALGELDIKEKGLAEYDRQKKQLQSESRYDQLNNQLESMMKAGAAKATGLKGRSAGKVLNSIAAFSGLNSQKLNDSLYSAVESVELKKSLEKESIALKRATVKDDIKLRRQLEKDGITLDTKYIKNTFDLKQGLEKKKIELEKTATSADIALRKSVQKQLNDLEKSTADKDIALRKKLQQKADTLDKDIAQKTLDARKTFEENTLSIRKTLTEAEQTTFNELVGAEGIKAQQIQAGKKQTKDAAKLKQDEIAQALGVDVEELESSKEKLAESIMSAGESAKIQLEDIENKAFEAQNQSYAQRMLEPVFGPALPAPFKTPKTEYVEPLPPIPATKGSVKGGSIGGTSTPQPSTLSTALSIGSAVAGIAAPFTGPAAPVVGGIAAAGSFLADLFK